MSHGERTCADEAQHQRARDHAVDCAGGFREPSSSVAGNILLEQAITQQRIATDDQLIGTVSADGVVVPPRSRCAAVDRAPGALMAGRPAAACCMTRNHLTASVMRTLQVRSMSRRARSAPHPHPHPHRPRAHPRSSHIARSADAPVSKWAAAARTAATMATLEEVRWTASRA